MTIFGECLTTESMAANVTGPGVWDGASGTFTATLPGKGTCGGAGGGDKAQVNLTMKSCGTLKVTCTATGYTTPNARATATAAATTGGVTLVSLHNDQTDIHLFDYCLTKPMTGQGTGTSFVGCGIVIFLQLFRETNINNGEITATFHVEVLP